MTPLPTFPPVGVPEEADWIAWRGRSCPVSVHATIEPMHRDGHVYPAGPAPYWTKARKLGTDIIAYRVVTL